MEGFLDLINSAVVHQDVKGGLRWPLGKNAYGDRFRVVKVWHTVYKSYVNPFVRLKLRNADRYDFMTSAGEATKEVTLKLKHLTSELLVGHLPYSLSFLTRLTDLAWFCFCMIMVFALIMLFYV